MESMIRKAEARDLEAVNGLLRQVLAVHHKGRPDLFNLATKYAPEELKALLQNDETPVFVGADEEGHVLGHGFCVLQHSGGQLMEEHDTLYIDDICVDEAARGLGVGRALYDAILGFARERGCHNVTLNVWSCNPGAMKFYEKMGLVPYKVGMEQIL